MAITPEEGLAKIHDRFGAHAGHRALHAKGGHYTATFTATPPARELTRAGHMSGDPAPANVRFSNGGGDPTVPDYAPDVRGLAVSFQLADGTSTDILAQTIPHFPFPGTEGFFAAMAMSERKPSSLLKLPLFALRYPRAVVRLGEVSKVTGRRASFAARRYFAFHAFKWLDAEGGERFVRYFWLPTVDEPDFSKEEAKRRGRDYLFDELAERLAREPVRMQLQVQIAEEGDDPDDPSSEWPDERERVIVGTLEIVGLDHDADDAIVYDPMRLVDGIEASNDPVLHYRPRVYDVSHGRRAGG